LTLSALSLPHHRPLPANRRLNPTESRFTGRLNESFATWGNSGIEPDEGTGNQLFWNV
jgi:hypothetical protein